MFNGLANLISSNDLNAVAEILQANEYEADEAYMNYLFKLAIDASVDMLELLLQYFPDDYNARDEIGLSVIDYAVSTKKDDEIMEALRNHNMSSRIAVNRALRHRAYTCRLI